MPRREPADPNTDVHTQGSGEREIDRYVRKLGYALALRKGIWGERRRNGGR